MHSTKINKTIFLHNGDFSGNIIIKRENQEIEIPTVDLIGLVAEIVCKEKILHLEEATSFEILGLIEEY